MFRERKRQALLALFIVLIIAIVGCSSANTTSSSEKIGSLAEQSTSQENELELLANSIEVDVNNLEEQEIVEDIEKLDKQVVQEIDKEQQIKVKEEQAAEEGQKLVEQSTDKESGLAERNRHVESEPAEEPQSVGKEPQPATVSLSIVGPQGEDYIILDRFETAWQDGDTVLEVLKRVTRAERIHLEYRGRNRTAYIEGIDNLYEFDHGPLSGWVYRVNGVFPSNSAGAYSVEKGDLIEWLYTLDLGQDVGGHMQGVQGE